MIDNSFVSLLSTEPVIYFCILSDFVPTEWIVLCAMAETFMQVRQGKKGGNFKTNMRNESVLTLS